MYLQITPPGAVINQSREGLEKRLIGVLGEDNDAMPGAVSQLCSMYDVLTGKIYYNHK